MQAHLKVFVATLAFIFCIFQLTRVIGCDPLLTRPKPSTYNETLIDVTNDPIQTDYRQTSPIVLHRDGNNYVLTPVAKYTLSGRIVSQRRYYDGWDYGLAAELSPVDIAMTWGDLAKPSMDEYVHYDHGQRFVHFHYTSALPVTAEYLVSHASNTHLIPATSNVERVIKTLKKNEIASLDGYLVNMRSERKGGVITWSTSLVRTDTGGGACELMYVTEVRVGTAVYR